MAETALAVQQPAPLGVLDVINNAVANNATVEVMERLYALYERQEAARAKASYIAAMSAFQAQCPIVQKRKSVPDRDGKTAYKYAPLDHIIRQVGALIAANGFSYSFATSVDDKGAPLETMQITHIGGHSETTSYPVKLGTKTGIMSDTQYHAAAYTFAKRYCFCNGFGILTGDEDVDGGTQPWWDKSIHDEPGAVIHDGRPEDRGKHQPKAKPTERVDVDYTVPPPLGRPASKGPLLTGAWITVNLSSGSRQMVQPPGHKEKLACYSWYAAAEDGTGETIQTYHQNQPRTATGLDAPESYIGAVDVKLKRSGDYCMIADMRAVQDEPARDAEGALL